MAEQATEGAEAHAEAKPTRRVVIKRETVVVLPPGVDDGVVQVVLKALTADKAVKATKAKPAPVEAWVVVAEHEGSKAQAIESFAGKAGTPDAIVGAYRAPSLSAWTGGLLYDAPPLPLVERRSLDDGATS